MSNIYGIKIKGLVIFNYKACIQGKAKKTILQRQLARIVSRLLQYIHFDLFYLENAYNQMRYALVIKDEFSRYIWVYSQLGRTQDKFLQAFKAFLRIIKVQYDLYICQIHQDNEKLLGKQQDDQIRCKGIKEKPSLLYTKQPVRNGKQAGGVICL